MGHIETRRLKQLEKMKQFVLKHEVFFQIVLLIIISSAIYLPYLGQLQYYKDDWYYVLDGLYGGPTIFNEMFSIDRPARGPFFQIYFYLFDANPLPYHLGQYLWHVLAAISALWLFRMVWPDRNRQAFYATLFFMIYPGYLWWISGIEYQPMMISLFLQVLSIALTVKAILSRKLLHKVFLVIGSILSGWGYLLLVDYAIGMEFFRFALIFVLVNRANSLSVIQRGWQTIKVWLYTSFLIPAGFLFWRVFLFSNERKVTDLGTQLALFMEAPRQALKIWLVGLVRDGLTISVLAWIEPFSQSFWNLTLNEILIGLFFAGLLVIFVFAVCHLLRESLSNEGNLQPLIIGLVSCFFAVIPIIIANRYIDFGPFSHYSLPASLSSALFLASLVAFISSRQMQYTFVSLVVAAAALTHYALAVTVVQEINIVNSFWWQAYWRAPGIRAGTTLIVDYPVLGFDDQIDNVWGPANLLYYPENRQQEIPVQYKLAALPLVGPEFENAFSKGELETGYRTHSFTYNVDKMLVLSQPFEGACVRVFNGSVPILSSSDAAEIRMVVSYSKIETVMLDSPDHLPPAVFGEEPEHGWCYYFEKVDLAVQQGDWGSALSLANEALAMELSPEDPVEWVPFLITYMIDDDIETITTLARKIKKDEALEKQVCSVLLQSYPWESLLTQEMNAITQFLFCPEGGSE